MQSGRQPKIFHGVWRFWKEHVAHYISTRFPVFAFPVFALTSVACQTRR